MNPIIFLSWRVWAAIAIAALLAASHWKAYNSGAQGVQAAWDAYTVAAQAETMKIQQETRDKESKLQAERESIRKAKNVQIAKLDADLANALDRLRNRPDRPGEGDLSATTGSGSSTGCTGANLFRPDGEFLIRESSRADKLLADLGQCQAQYAKAVEATSAD